MNVDALPKILFLHEESEQMQDRRIRSKVQYDISAENPKKVVTKKINNTIELTDKLKSKNQINCLAYSNKHGVMITCMEKEILLTDYNHLQDYLATSDTNKKSLQSISSQLQFSGKIYLTPDESKFLAVNSSQLLLFDIPTLTTLSRTTNQHQLRHFVFVNDKIFVGWNFYSSAYVYSIINSTICENSKLQIVYKCTSINIINEHIIACEKVNQGEDDEDTRLIVFDSKGTEIKNEISLHQFENNDNYIFNFTQIISIFTIKQDTVGQFGSNDVYGLVLAYYDDYEQEPDRRYLNFLKGDLLIPGSDLQIRGFQLFLSPTQDRTFYYNQNHQKIPFEVQIITSGSIKIIMIEKLQVVYVVDCTQQFSNLNLYTIQPNHEIKLQDRKYFQGICLMRNMLQAQRKPPAKDSNEICDIICRQFNGEFLSLYFSSKETQLTVPFPASIMVLGDGRIMRRYAIQTVESIEEYEVQKVKEAIGKIKRSRYVQNVQSPVKIIPGTKTKSGENQSTEGMKQKQQMKKQQGLFEQSAATTPALNSKSPFDIKPATQEKKSSSLFNQPIATGSIFAQPTQKKSSGSIFNNLSNIDQDKKPSLFTKIEQSTPNLFSSPAFTQEQKPSTGLFDKKSDQEKKPALLFDQKDDKKQADGLFGSQENKGSFFSLQQPKQANTAEEKKQTSISPANILFQKASKQQQSKSLLIDITQKKPKLKQVPKTQSSLFAPNQPKTTEPKLQAAKYQQPQKQDFITASVATSIPQPKLSLPQSKAINFPVAAQQQQGGNLLNQSKTIGVFKPKSTQGPLKVQQQKEQKEKQKQVKVTQDVQPNQERKRQQVVSQNKQKLQELAQLMGFGSVQLIPGPLRELTSQQGDALIQSLKNMAKLKDQGKQEKKLSQQEMAREKLLKKEHFYKIIKQIDEAKDYIKGVKQANNVIASDKIFALKNVKSLLLKQRPVLNLQKNQDLTRELKSKNKLVNIVRDYARKMQMFAMVQRNTCTQDEKSSQEINKKRHLLREAGPQKRAIFIQQRLLTLQDQVNQLVYYQDAIFQQKSISERGKVNFHKILLQDRWVNIGKKKIFSSQQLIKQALSVLLKQQQIRKQNMKLSLPVSANNNSKSVSVITNVSSKQEKHKKGRFAFNLSSSDNSQNEQQQFIRPDINHKSKVSITSGIVNKKKCQQSEEQHYPDENNNKRRILIRLKPKTMTLSPDLTLPLIILPSTFTSPLYVPQKFNALEMFKQGSHSSQLQPMQASTKKQVNFSQRIPLKRQESQLSDKNNNNKGILFNNNIKGGKQQLKPKLNLEQQQMKSAQQKKPSIAKTKKYDQSLELSSYEEEQQNENSLNESEQEDNNLLQGMTRTISKFNPLPNTTGNNTNLLKQQGSKQLLSGLQIKKTKQSQVPEKKDLQQQTKQAALIFGQASSSQASSKTNINLAQDKIKTKPEQKPVVGGLFGATSGAVSLFASNDNVKLFSSTATTKTEQQKPTFGLSSANKTQPPSTQAKGGLFSSSFNQTTKPQQSNKQQSALSIDKKQETKAQSKQPPQTQSLFGNQTKSLFSGLSLSNQPNKGKQEATIQSDIKAAQKAASQNKQLKKQQAKDKQNKPHPTNSLFGATTQAKPLLFSNNNTTNLFGQSTTTAVNKLQSNKQNKKQNQQPSKQTQSKPQGGLFGTKSQVSSTNSLFGQSGGLFAKKSTEPANQKEQSSQVKKTEQQKEAVLNQPTAQPLFGNLQKQQQKLPKQPQQPQKQPQEQSKPLLFQNNNVQQPTSIQFNAPTTMFGGTNRFLGSQQQQQQTQQSQSSALFNPNATAFRDNNVSFGTSSSGGFKSFANFGESKTSGIFGQSNPQSQLFTNTNAFSGQNTTTQQPNQFQQQQSSLFTNQQQPQPQQQSSMFNQLQPQNTSQFGQSGNNFFSAFNPSGMNLAAGGPSSNPSLLKPRK